MARYELTYLPLVFVSFVSNAIGGKVGFVSIILSVFITNKYFSCSCAVNRWLDSGVCIDVTRPRDVSVRLPRVHSADTTVYLGIAIH